MKESRITGLFFYFRLLKRLLSSILFFIFELLPLRIR
jgi:hypothetical protein